MKAVIGCFLCALAAGAVTPQAPIEYLRTVPSVREFTKPRSFFTKLLNFVAGPPEGRPELLRPYATTHDSAGRLLVADPGQQGIHIYDFEKHKYQFLKGPKGRLMASPIDVACDSDDNIYVSDSVRARIYVFDSRGRFLRTVGESRLVRPTGMALDRASRLIYLTDTLRHQVLVFRLDGGFVRAIGQARFRPGRIQFPHGPHAVRREAVRRGFHEFPGADPDSGRRVRRLFRPTGKPDRHAEPAQGNRRGYRWKHIPRGRDCSKPCRCSAPRAACCTISDRAEPGPGSSSSLPAYPSTTVTSYMLPIR